MYGWLVRFPVIVVLLSLTVGCAKYYSAYTEKFVGIAVDDARLSWDALPNIKQGVTVLARADEKGYAEEHRFSGGGYLVQVHLGIVARGTVWPGKDIAEDFVKEFGTFDTAVGMKFDMKSVYRTSHPEGPVLYTRINGRGASCLFSLLYFGQDTNDTKYRFRGKLKSSVCVSETSGLSDAELLAILNKIRIKDRRYDGKGFEADKVFCPYCAKSG